MLGGSPTSVAVPWRFEERQMPRMNGTGETFNLRDTSNAIGATINTVATFSTKADITPLKADSQIIAQTRFLERSMIISAR